MSVVHTIEHELAFAYDRAVHGSVMTLFVSPRADRHQSVHDFALATDPAGPVSEFADPYGNRGHFFDRHAPHRELRITVRALVEVNRPATAAGNVAPGARVPAEHGNDSPDLWLMLQPSRFVRPSSAALAGFVSDHGIVRGDDPVASLRSLLSTLYGVFEYAPGSTEADSPIGRILETGQGVCQDYAHVMASICRGWGIPTRYVSGYLAPRAGTTVPGESHAWVECWVPELGWTGFDPTNDCVCDERHVRVAVGRDYADVPPSRGVFSGFAESVLTTRVTVTSRKTGAASNGNTDFRTTTFSRSIVPCNPASDPATSEPSSGSRQSSSSLPRQHPRADSPRRSAPMLSAAMCGAAPISGSRWRFSPR